MDIFMYVYSLSFALCFIIYKTFPDTNNVTAMSPENEDNLNSMSSAYTGKYLHFSYCCFHFFFFK